MNKLLSAAVIAATVALASAPAAAATTLTFSGACNRICNTTGDYISQSYGDIDGILDISYRSVAAPGSSIEVGPIGFWGTNYGDLTGVVFGVENATVEIAFRLLDPTKIITLNSVDFASWDGLTLNTQFAIYSLASSNFSLELDTTGSLVSPANGHSMWSPTASSATGLLFHFGPDAYRVAIDNLTFTISDINAVTPVPEAATWLSMILGFGVVGAAMRRRSSLRSAVAIV